MYFIHQTGKWQEKKVFEDNEHMEMFFLLFWDQTAEQCLHTLT